jgi:hypothetical protein
LSCASALGSAASPERGIATVEVASQDSSGVTLKLRIPQSAVELGFDPDGRGSLAIRGLQQVLAPGLPELPVAVASVGVPDRARIEWSVIRLEESGMSLPSIRHVARLDEAGGRWVSDEDPEAYRPEAPWPQRRVEMEILRFGSLRIARLLIYPARYCPDAGELLLSRAMDIRIDFKDGESFEVGSPLTRLEDRILDRVLLNRETLRGEQTLDERMMEESTHPLPSAGRSAVGGVGAEAGVTAGDPGVKIHIDQEGLVRVARSELEAAGFNPLGVEPRNLELSYRGIPVPCRLVGEEDGSFDPEDFLEFYGVPGSGRYSAENVYWLEERTDFGLRFSSRAAPPGGAPRAATFPHTEHYEENGTIYTYGTPPEAEDSHFYWAWFEDNPTPPRLTTFSVPVDLPGLDATAGDSSLRAFFSGQTDPPETPDHQVRFSVNGVEIGESSWNGRHLYMAELRFDSALLAPGTNTLRLDYVPIAFPDRYYLDWIEIEYPRATVAVADRLTLVGERSAPVQYRVSGLGSVQDPFVLDVTDPFAPVQLTGAEVSGSGPFSIAFEEAAPEGSRYLVVGDGGRIAAAGLELDLPSSLRDPANGADLIIVVPDGWDEALASLAAHRRTGGLRVVLAALGDVADEFAGGNPDDVAIRDFIAYAYENWQAPPVSSVLLVGEPNLDVLNYLEMSPFYHLMPSHFAFMQAWGETVSDSWFGAVAGDDPIPEVAVGRFSVRTPEQAEAIALKIVDYENHPPEAAPWGSNALLVASNHVLFENALEAAAQHLPSHFTVTREYRLAGASVASIVGSFDSGAVLASFLGHGNITSWGDNPGGIFFTATDAATISNQARLPLLTATNCLNGLVGNPYQVDSMAEAFHNPPATGALAVWAPSSYGYLAEFEVLQQVLYRTLFEDHLPYIGAATLSAMVETYLTVPASVDLLKEMILLGDPSGWLAIDSDGDGLLDATELRAGLDPGDRDSEDDGLLDGLEGGPGADTDGDGLENALDPDSDEDGLPDGLEAGVDVPDAHTDISRGFFRPDADPSSTTDPFSADTDGGGVADGAEDRDADGMVTPPETDPLSALDDASCGVGAPGEIAYEPGGYLEVRVSGDDLVLEWGDAGASNPCILYRVYGAEQPDAECGAGFSRLASTGRPSYTHVGAASTPGDYHYLVAGATLAGGEGPTGHSCSVAAASPGETAGPALPPLRVTGFDRLNRTLSLSYGVACNSRDNTIVFGQLPMPTPPNDPYAYIGEECGIGSSGEYVWQYPGSPESFFFVLVGNDGFLEGPYGTSSSGDERPPHAANMSCPLPQEVANRCD